jgi:hypothetical protein
VRLVKPANAPSRAFRAARNVPPARWICWISPCAVCRSRAWPPGCARWWWPAMRSPNPWGGSIPRSVRWNAPGRSMTGSIRLACKPASRCVKALMPSHGFPSPRGKLVPLRIRSRRSSAACSASPSPRAHRSRKSPPPPSSSPRPWHRGRCKAMNCVPSWKAFPPWPRRWRASLAFPSVNSANSAPRANSPPIRFSPRCWAPLKN